ncbi:MAG: hypothetical protein JXA18_09260 [Chitinispirillaceae bacterium]|nr:hypothetical protein [Chitinispirillaceae bacterium]
MKYLFALAVCIGASAIVSAGPDNLKITPKGYGSFEIGQIGHGYYKSSASDFFEEIGHVWQQRAFANLGFSVHYRDKLQINIAGEGLIAFSTPQIGKFPTTLQTRQFFYIKTANALISFVDSERFTGQLQVGFFPYKYNHGVRNLGEYLFRSNPYPLVVYADFDYPQADLLGLRGHIQLFNELIENDLLVHSELLAHPIQDWSVSDIISCNLLNKSVSVGLGVSLYHIFSAYQGKYMGSALDGYYYPPNVDSTLLVSWSDTVMDRSAVNCMARLSFDPKRFLPLSVFGENDLRLYGEIDLLGVEDYEPFYQNRNERMLFSFGFNLPGFKVIDLLNLEFEYCENKSAFSDQLFYGVTKPSYEPMNLSTYNMKRVPWRWSLYIKKTFLDQHLGFITQFGRDHKKINFYYINLAEMSFAEVLPTKDDWWWVFKTEFKF